MESINNTPVGTPMEFQWRGGTYTALNISHLLKFSDVKPDPSALNGKEEFGKLVSSDAYTVGRFWDHDFSDGAMSSSPVISGAYSRFTHQIDCAVGSFMDGGITKEELASRFETMLDEFSNACEEAGYPHPLFCDGFPTVLNRTKALYTEMRDKILEIAVNRNDAEGQKYVSGGKGFGGDWKYYNSDYYYKSEDAISALFDGVSSYTEGRNGYHKFDLQEIEAQLTQYTPRNFNSAWNNRYPLNQQCLMDERQAPPEGFKWFYQKGGSHGKQHSVIGKIYLDGREVEQTVHRAPFDPTKDTSATTWASYRDASGKEHRVSTDFLFDVDGVDKYLTSTLLQFTGSKAQAFNEFLENLRVNSGNWWRPDDTPVIDLRV